MPVVDLYFPVVGNTIAQDHGYELYSALCRQLPELHRTSLSVAVLPIHGLLVGNRRLALTNASTVTIRLPSEEVWRFVGLAGKSLRVGGQSLNLGVPNVRGLVASPRLYSRFVTVKGHTEPESFLGRLREELVGLGVEGPVSIPHRTRHHSVEGRSNLLGGNPLIRRTLRVRDRQIVGFAVQVDQLSPEGSLRLQEVGLGGRRRMGAGIFLPTATLKPGAGN